MNLIFSLAVAVLFGTGIFLLLKHDLLRNAIGLSLVSNSVIVFIVTAGLSRGDAPIHPLPAGVPISDPLVQALALTAVVINFGVTVFVLALIYRIYTTHRTLSQIDIRKAEEREVAETEQLKEPKP